VDDAVVVQRDADDVPGRVVRLSDVVHVRQVVDGTVRRSVVYGRSFILVLLQTHGPATAWHRTPQDQPSLVPLLQRFTPFHTQSYVHILPVEERLFYSKLLNYFFRFCSL